VRHKYFKQRAKILEQEPSTLTDKPQIGTYAILSGKWPPVWSQPAWHCRKSSLDAKVLPRNLEFWGFSVSALVSLNTVRITAKKIHHFMLFVETGYWSQIRGGSTGAIIPPKTYESITLFTIICTIRETAFAILDHLVVHCFVTAVCVVKYISSLAVVKPLWDLTTKYYWNQPPKLTDWIRSWANQYPRKWLKWSVRVIPSFHA